MLAGDPRQHCFTYLYDDEQRRVPFTRLDDKRVEVTLACLGRRTQAYEVQYDARDQRVLVVYDGEIPWCGLPRAASQQAQYPLQQLRSGPHECNKPRPCELPAPFHIGEEGVTVELKRRFLLLRGGNALLLRYRERSLAGCYSLVTVFYRTEERVEVAFTNTDY